jgi:hypothetical protein
MNAQPAFTNKKVNYFICFVIFVFTTCNMFAQTVQIVANPSTSGNIVVGPNNYHVSENIYTEVEIGSSNFTTLATSINRIDFNVVALGTNTTVNNFAIYLRNIPLANTNYTTGIYSTTGYTLVFSGTYTPSVIGWVGVDLTTPFVRTIGSNLELLIERFDGTAHGAFSFRSANGNETSATITSSRRVNASALPVSGTTILNTASAFKPQLQLKHITANDASVVQVYTLGKLPIPFAAPHVVSANILNNGSNAISNLAVTLSISGANSFTDIQTIASLASGASTTVNFTAFTPTNIGSNTVSVSVPSDDFNANNSKAVSQNVTGNSYTYAYGTTPSSSVGINANTGDFVAKFTTSSPTSINQVGVNFTSSGLPFRIGVWDKSGTGLPGALLWESTIQTTTNGVFTLPINPPVAIADTFYIGVRQIGTTNIQFAYQDETPIRANTFFFTAPSGSTTWSDFSPGNPFKFMIEPRLTLADDVGVSAISNPVSLSNIDNCGLQPQAVINNFGSNDQLTPFNATFIIKQGGIVVYNNTQSLSLNSGEAKVVDFAPFTGSVNGIDSAFCYTSLATDAASNNDTVVNRFTTNNFSFSGATVTSGGYLFANSTNCAAASSFQPAYNWIDETSNEIDWASNGDDSVLATPINLPFNFPYFGGNYTQCWISSNGWISFSNPTTLTAIQQRTPVSIATAGGIENYIAGLHTDLDVTTATYTDARTFYGGDASQFIITYRHAHAFGSADDFITFQIILKPDGNIFIQYNNLETSSPIPTSLTNSCGIGIENTNGTLGMQYRFNGNLGSVFGSPLALQFKAPVPVPVGIINFTAFKNETTNKIIWTIGQELNVQKYIIQKSKDGVQFEQLKTVNSLGNTNRERTYETIDNTPFVPISFYRLKIIDNDNSYTFSRIVSVQKGINNQLSLYPNPAKNKFTVSLNSDDIEPYTFILVDVKGFQLLQQTTLLQRGSNQIIVNADKIAAGQYILKAVGTKKTFTQKITIL